MFDVPGDSRKWGVTPEQALGKCVYDNFIPRYALVRNRSVKRCEEVALWPELPRVLREGEVRPR